MSDIQPFRVSEPRAVNTIFGAVMVPGPFADDYTRLKYEYKDHWSGESARFRAAGLELYVKDCDGDFTVWQLKDLRTGQIISDGSEDHFFAGLARAEFMLRTIVDLRKARLKHLAAQS
jgi:hypothetical protein